MSIRRKFSDEFKREAVAQTQVPGVTRAQVARELGINANMLSRWARELAADGRLAFQGHGKPRDGELAATRRELARVRRERDFLKEAAVFFAKASK